MKRKIMTRDSSGLRRLPPAQTPGHPHRPSAGAQHSRPVAGGVFRFVLAMLPFIGMLVLVPFVNRVEPYVFDLPFLLFWIVVWVVLTSVCMTVIYFTDPANKAEGRS